jgi:hypothetical protein
MARVRMILGALALAAALAAAACTDDDDIPTEPTDPTPTTVTETFAGSISTNGARTEPFTVNAGGTVQAVLSKVEPDAAVVVGLSLGTWNGTSCQVVLANDQATQGSLLTATVSAAGRLCVRVYDAAGTLGGPITYEISLVHP